MEDSINSNPVPTQTEQADDKKGKNTILVVLTVVAAAASAIIKVLTEIKGGK